MPAALVEERLVRPALAEGPAGEDSLDCRGDAVREVVVEGHLDGCVSTLALDVADE